ncbi:MAG: translation initiation factor IF-2 [Methanobacteriota archaeon]|nr:MAG: translation initiation factor IF-2 [Euryarchaeota archaeon]
MKEVRSPIVSVLGHVDHGKTTLLDAIRGSNVAKKEAGKITQMIGASIVEKKTIEELSKELKDVFKTELIIPGLLFIDTPGHEVFSNLRVRGGSIADIAILVIDIKQGIQPQTVESIKILQNAKTPFVVALNKVDLIDGWKESGSKSFLKALSKQADYVKERVENRIYEVMGELSQHGFDSERFDRVDDFTKQLSLIPMSAKTEEGMAELLLLVAGLSQRYLKDKLYIDREAEAKGSVMEVKEEKGLGTTVDVILYDGILKEGDSLKFMTKEGIMETRVRALLLPNVSSNNPKEKYRRVKEVVAAAGVKIAAPNLEEVLAGSPFTSGKGDELEKELKSIIFESNEEGVVAKADSLGSAEALLNLLRKEGIAVAKLDIGKINKEDINLASVMGKKNRKYGVVLAFNIRLDESVELLAKEEGVRIIDSDVVYRIPELYKEFVDESAREESKEIEEKVAHPVKIMALPGFFFRESKPAVLGIEVLEGKLKPGIDLIKEDGKIVGELKSIQDKGKSLKEAEKGSKVAVSVDGAVLHKDIEEGDVLYSYLNREAIELWKESSSLTEEEKALVEEIVKIERKARLRKL